jgi:hypothetical protein
MALNTADARAELIEVPHMTSRPSHGGRPMSNIDKRALREAAANAKIAGERSAVRPANHCTERLETLYPDVLVLLDEIAELGSDIAEQHC